MNYSELTRRYFEIAPLAGSLGGVGVRRGSAGSRDQGTWVQFELELGEGVVRDARFLALGCPHVIAAAAFMTELAIGRAAGSPVPQSAHALLARFEVPAEKLGRLLLLEDAWAALWTGD